MRSSDFKVLFLVLIGVFAHANAQLSSCSATAYGWSGLSVSWVETGNFGAGADNGYQILYGPSSPSRPWPTAGTTLPASTASVVITSLPPSATIQVAILRIVDGAEESRCVATATTDALTAGTSADSYGTSFTLAFSQNADGQNVLSVVLTPRDTAGTAIVSTVGFSSGNVNVVPGEATTVIIPTEHQVTYEDLALPLLGVMKGIRITSSVEIAVYGWNTDLYSTDGFAAYPDDVQGNEYIVVSPNAQLGQLLMTGIEDNTNVIITTNCESSLGVAGTYTFTLSALQVKFVHPGALGGLDLEDTENEDFIFPNYDMSGWRIFSSRPIAVTTEAACAYIPHTTTSFCDKLAEMLTPTATWDNEYVLRTFNLKTGGDFIRLVSGSDANTFTVINQDGNQVQTGTLQFGESAQFILPSQRGYVISSTGPLEVMQLMTSEQFDQSTKGDPSSVILPGSRQWLSYYSFTSPDMSNVLFWDNWLNIATKTAHIAGMTVDGMDISSYAWRVIAGTEYSTVSVNVFDGAHVIRSSNPTRTFSVVAYGFGDEESYAFNAGMSLAPIGLPCINTESSALPGDGIDNDCDGRIDEEISGDSDLDSDGKVGEDMALTCCPVVTISAADFYSQPSATYTDTCSGLAPQSAPTISQTSTDGGFCVTYTATATPNFRCSDPTPVTATLDGGLFTTTVAAPATYTGQCNRFVASNYGAPTMTSGQESEYSIVETQSLAPGGPWCGTTKHFYRTWVVTDVCGQSQTVTQAVNVIDTEGPYWVTFPDDFEMECGAHVEANPDITGRPIAKDNCSPVAYDYDDIVYLMDYEGQCGKTYKIARKWIFRDECDNKIERVQTITFVDTTPPTFTQFPADTDVECTASLNTDPCATGHPVATDACGSVRYEYTDATVANTVVRTWSAIDNCGLSVTSTQTLTQIDTVAPTWTSTPRSQTIECGTVPTFSSPTASDACDSSVEVSFDTEFAAGCGGGAGVTTYTWTATDDAGNEVQYTNSLTRVDHTDPTITAPASQLTMSCTASFDPSVTGSATATDTCTANPVITHTDVVAPRCGTTKTVLRTWKATDDCGNHKTVVQTLTSVDTEGPVLTLPAHVTVQCTESTSVDDLGRATATDVCGTATTPTYTDSIVAGGCTQNFKILRTWRSVDQCNNVATAVQTITVQDTSAPTVPSTPRCIWPANKKWVCFDKASTTTSFLTPSDNCAAAGKTSITITGCSINEADTNSAGGNFMDDCKLTSNDRMCFFAQKNSPQSERVYTVSYSVKDPCNNMVSGTQTVTIPVHASNGECINPSIASVRSLLGAEDEELVVSE